MILTRTLRATIKHSRVHDAAGRMVQAAWGLRGSAAYLDLASVSGLALLPQRLRNPMKTSTRGLGELLASAARHGARRLFLGVGGSATVDGGVGAMRALGIRFLDRRGKEIPEGGRGLHNLARIETHSCQWTGLGIEITILVDVRNPLLGPNGAAAVFGPQKGAPPWMVRGLEHGLRCLNHAIVHHRGSSVTGLVAGGAAGGVVAGLVGILGTVPGVRVEVVPGADHVIDALGVPAAMKTADWVLTGEGRLDKQSAQGKTINSLCRLAVDLRKPVVAFAGQIDLGPPQIRALGLRAAFAITPGVYSLEDCFRHTARWLRRTVAHVISLVSKS